TAPPPELPPADEPLLPPFPPALLPPPPLPLPLPLPPLLAVATLVEPALPDPESAEAPTVELLRFVAPRAPATAPGLRASPWVTRLTFTRTSPSADEIRVAPCLAPLAERGLSGADRPLRGTGTRSIVEARGGPFWIGCNAPEPPSERPALPLENAVAC